MTEKTAVLRQHYPELAALFAQWDSCYARFMLERDQQLEANGIRLYPKQAFGGGGD